MSNIKLLSLVVLLVSNLCYATDNGWTAPGTFNVATQYNIGGSQINMSNLAGTVTNAQLAGSIAASKFVGTDITTVGTITSGVWNAGAVTSSGDVSVALTKSLKIAQGTNGCNGQATLSSGTVTISTTCTPSSSNGIFLTDAGGTITNIGILSLGTITNATSFVINSTNVLDASTVNWLIIKH